MGSLFSDIFVFLMEKQLSWLIYAIQHKSNKCIIQDGIVLKIWISCWTF